MRREWAIASLVFAAMALLFTATGFLPDRVMLPLDLPRDYGAWKPDPAQRVVVSNKDLSDSVLEFHAWDVAARRALAQGEFPWRNVYAADGAPLFANPESGLAFPLTWLRIALGDRGWVVVCFLKLFAGALGMWWLARVMTGASPRFALASGFVYATCGYFTVWLLSPHTNVYAVLPWLAAALYVGRASARPAGQPAGLKPGLHTLAIIAAAALATAGGHPETLFYGVVAIAIFLLWERRATALGYAAIGFAIVAVQLVPFAIAASRSALLASRAAGAPRFVRFFAIPATFLPGFLGSPLAGEIDLSGLSPMAENFNERAGGYAGLVALILVLYAWRHLPRAARRGIVIGCVALLLSFVPLFPIGASHRLGLVFAFFVSAAVGRSLEALAPRLRGSAADLPLPRGRVAAWPLLISATIVLAIAIIVIATPFAQPILSNLARAGIAKLQHRGYLHQTTAVYEARLARYLAGFATVALRRIAVPAFCVVLVAIALMRRSVALAAAAIVIEMVTFAYGYNPVIRREQIAPTPPMIAEVQRRDPARRYFVAAAIDVYPPNLATVDGVRDLRANDVLQSRDRIASLVRLGYDPELKGFAGAPPPQLAALGVRWFLTRRGLIELPNATSPPWPANTPPDGFTAGAIVSVIALLAAIESFFARR